MLNNLKRASLHWKKIICQLLRSWIHDFWFLYFYNKLFNMYLRRHTLTFALRFSPIFIYQSASSLTTVWLTPHEDSAIIININANIHRILCMYVLTCLCNAWIRMSCWIATTLQKYNFLMMSTYRYPLKFYNTVLILVYSIHKAWLFLHCVVLFLVR